MGNLAFRIFGEKINFLLVKNFLSQKTLIFGICKYFMNANDIIDNQATAFNFKCNYKLIIIILILSQTSILLQ